MASRRQLLALGVSDNVMQYRLRRGGPWQTLLPGVYLAASGIPSVSQKEMAALIYAGPGSLVTGPTALGVAGEVDSRAWHLSPEDWDRTRRRHDLMAAAGIIVLHFSPRELRREPTKVAEMIKGALNRGLTRPSLPIRTVPCPGSVP